MRSRAHRSNKGSMVVLAFVGLVPLIAAIGGLAVDLMHFNDERGALQRATDAGALAGAYALTSWTGTATQQGTASGSVPGGCEVPVTYALKTSFLNWVDGTYPQTINAEVLNSRTGEVQMAFNGGLQSSSTMPQFCHVFATTQITSLFAGIFGLHQTVQADSLAGTINGAVFPVTLSASGAMDGTGTAVGLSGLHAGGTLGAGSTIMVKNRPGGDAIWGFDTTNHPTGANLPGIENSWVNQQTVTGENGITVGQTLNGNHGTIMSASISLPVGTIVSMPVATDASGNLQSPGPPNDTPQIAGFITIKITAAGSTSDSFTGTILAVPASSTTFITQLPASDKSTAAGFAVFGAKLLQ